MTTYFRHTLGSMLRYRRPHGSHTERMFIERFIAPLASPDAFGNYIVRIGRAPVLWSCHTDTVHNRGGIQRIVRQGALYALDPQEHASNCLGADCSTGVWLMVNMIQAGVEGLYIFHRGEECGGLGSSYIANLWPPSELLKDISFAIALDRARHRSIITHQLYGRCASDAFAYSLAQQLPYFIPDDTGVFTDTAQYTHLIPECTNLSVGYEQEHSRLETQDIGFAYTLLNRLIHLDISVLVVARDPSVVDDGAGNKEEFGFEGGRYDNFDFDMNLPDWWDRLYNPSGL
jgi:hypothetical protein